MSQPLSVQLCRIIAPEKLPDRFLASGVLTQNAEWSLASGVILSYVFEITKPWFPSSQVIPSLIGILTEQHSKLLPDATLGDQFELLLRAINQQLNTLSEQGETDWIGNFNGMIMVLGGEELHFSQTGSSPAYLLQNNRIRQITDEPPGDQPHPLKTFSNLASGILKPNDHLLISNHELYREVSLDALRRIIGKSTPYQSCQTITKELKRSKMAGVSTIIIKACDPATLRPVEPTEIILEDEMQSSLKKAQKRMMPFAALVKRFSIKAGKAGVSTAQQVGVVVQTKVAPKAMELAKRGAEEAKNVSLKVSQRFSGLPAEEKVAEEVIAQPETIPVVERVLPRDQRNEPAPEVKNEAVYQEPPSLIPAEELALDSAEPIGLMSTQPRQEKKPLRQSFTAWISHTRNRKLVALVTAALMITIGIGSAISRRKPVVVSSSTAQNTKILDQVSALEKKIDTAIGQKQEIEASKDAQSVEQLLPTLKDLTDTQKQQLTTLSDALTAQEDTLSHTTRLTTAAATSSFTGTSAGLVANLPYFYGFTTGKPSLLRTGQGEASQTQQTTALSTPDDSIVSLAKSNDGDSAAYALTAQDKIYRVLQNNNATSLSPVQPASGEAFAKGDYLGTYLGNLYILDGVSGLLWKYANTGTSYAKGVSIIDKTKYDIKGGVSLAIDGSIFVLKKDGGLIKFSSGNQDTSFALKNLPYLSQKMVQPLQVITGDSMQSVFVLDGGITSTGESTAKVIEFDKSGSFVRQYGFPKNFTDVHAFDINPQDKKLWILNGGTVSEFSL